MSVLGLADTDGETRGRGTGSLIEASLELECVECAPSGWVFAKTGLLAPELADATDERTIASGDFVPAFEGLVVMCEITVDPDFKH